MESIITYIAAQTDVDFGQARHLFREYAMALGIDLSFQNFEDELTTIHLQYYQPEGVVWLAQTGENSVGCAGVRKWDEETAELKRMYVKSEYRGYGVGAELLNHCLQSAKKMGYQKMRLDTLPDMTKALSLYTSSGFTIIPPYRFNPFADAIYMEKML